MNAKKLSLVAILALSSTALRADILDLEYTRSDLASVEKVSAVLGTCKSVYEMVNGKKIAHGNVATALEYTGYVNDFTHAALESGSDVTTIKRIADACAAKAPARTWENKDYVNLATALTTAVAKELAHGFAVKTIKKHFGSTDKKRLYRRAMYVGKDTVLAGLFGALTTLVDNVLADRQASSWGTMKKDAREAAVMSLARHLVGEILVSTTEDDKPALEVEKANKYLDKLCDPIA